MGPIIIPVFPFEEDKYGLHYVCEYLEGFVDTAKRSIYSVIKALADDEKLDPFCRYLMFTHLYTPEQVKEIGYEEIYEKEKKLEKDLGLLVRYHEDDGTGGKNYEVTGFGWTKDGRAYVTVTSENVENSDNEIVDIPVPITLDEEWFRKLEEFKLMRIQRNIIQ